VTVRRIECLSGSRNIPHATDTRQRPRAIRPGTDLEASPWSGAVVPGAGDADAPAHGSGRRADLGRILRPRAAGRSRSRRRDCRAPGNCDRSRTAIRSAAPGATIPCALGPQGTAGAAGILADPALGGFRLCAAPVRIAWTDPLLQLDRLHGH